MKKTKTLIVIVATLLSLLLPGQTLKTTYFDFAKTRIDEQYYVNANGEKNGVYKSFWKDNGVLVEEATYLNGELNGPHKLYDPTSGKALMRQLETYKNNIKQGEAKYYGGNKYSVLMAHGSYNNGKKNGVWTYITPIDGKMPAGCEYYKSTTEYKDDEALKEGDVAYYYPSNKLFYQTKGRTTTGYYPDGKVSSLLVEDENGNTIKEVTYDKAGNILTQTGQ